ncbi:motility associated factor glycosyltransferase family protein [Niallia sp. 01092]|uniref:motility associated factor glycosyltransferase family protein n=1 Tax=unclassified Niallia TaxID=2837522 RepID=UPI003FD17824
MNESFIISMKEAKISQLPVTSVNQYPLHSVYNPIREAEKIVESHYKKNHLHILFGLGDGYIVDEFIEKIHTEDYLLVVEPNYERNIEHINKTMNAIEDFPNIQLVVFDHVNDLKNILLHLFSIYLRRVQFITSPNYAIIFPSICKEVMISIKDNMMSQIVNSNTMRLFSHSWQKNFSLNLFQAAHATPLKFLEQQFTCPIVVASGGPSLTKQIPLLKKYRKNFMLICAGSTINSLLKHHIEPDLIVSIDGGEPNYQHFKNINVNHIPLAYSLTIHHNIVEEHKGKQIVFNLGSHLPIKEWTNKLLRQDIGELQDGKSVANYALGIAHYITSGPICLVGQDLAYTNHVTHADGNKHSKGITENQIKERKMLLKKDINGEPVYTDYVFLGMKESFEYLVERVKSNRIYNCTDGGIPINGIPNKKFMSFMNECCHDNINESFLDLLNHFSVMEQDLDYICSEIQQILDDINTIKELSIRSLDILNEYPSQELFTNSNMLVELENIDDELKTLLKDDFMFYLLQEVIFQVNHYSLETENETDENAKERIYNKSKDLYEGIKGVCTLTVAYLEKVVCKLKREI